MIKIKANVNQKLKAYSTFFGNHFTTPPELNKSWVLQFSLKNISNQTVLVPYVFLYHGSQLDQKR